MDEITGLDIDDIERYCGELRAGEMSNKDFRTQVLASMGFSPHVIQQEQELLEIAELW